jgi:tetratricopeptide (TPR) repeat protein
MFASLRRLMGLIVLALLVQTPFGMAAGVLARDSASSLPPSYLMTGFNFEYQGWNNCGPATLTNALSYFGYTDDQNVAANWLKPNYEDKNVSPWQMAEFVNQQLAGNTRALVRQGGTLDRLKTLVANNFPVIIEEGYDPPPHDKGWMGHYLLVIGYDDSQQLFTSDDSYIGPNTTYPYDHLNDSWRDFNRLYIVLYDASREQELMALLGSDADENQNYINAFRAAQQEATANPQDAYSWFNMGTNLVDLQMYNDAATAFDQARNLGLPWRMMWYQFGPFVAYNAVGRYSDVIALAQANLNDGGGQYVEETFYYAGIAREAMGEAQRALDNYNGAVTFNPNFTPARIARDRLAAQMAAGGSSTGSAGSNG